MEPTAGVLRAPRLIADVRRTKNEDFGSVGIGVVCNIEVFIAAHGCFDGTRGFHPPGTLGRFDLGRGNEENQMPFWLLRTSRSFAAGRYVHRGSRHPRAAARNHRGIGHHARAGVNPPVDPSLVRWVGLFDRRARLDRRAGCHRHRVRQSVAIAPLCGLFATLCHSSAFSFPKGSFGRPSNTALQPSNGAFVVRARSNIGVRIAPTTRGRKADGEHARTTGAPFAAECEPLDG